jgi:hypothetical protein
VFGNSRSALRDDSLVSDLGDLLVLLHGARGRVSTVRATVRTWQHLTRRDEATARLVESGQLRAYGPLHLAGETVEGLTRYWIAPPDRAREEHEGDDGEYYAVRRGALWWRYDPENGALSNEDEPEIGGGIADELGLLLDAAEAIGVLDFPDIGTGRQAGRPTLCVRAVPRALADRPHWPLWRLGAMGADELLLDVDAERGMLLRTECRFERQPMSVTEVVEVAFDEQIPESTFVFTPPSGEEVRSVTERSMVRRDLTIEQAVALAPFTVWIPARLPAGWETEIGFAAGRDRPPMAPRVFLHCRTEDGTHRLTIGQGPADHPAADEEAGPGGPWRAVERNGRRMQIRDPAESWQRAQARLELGGTRILIDSGDLEADALADLGAGLVRAPAEPPELGE